MRVRKVSIFGVWGDYLSLLGVLFMRIESWRFAMLCFGQRGSIHLYVLRLQLIQKWGICKHLAAEVHPIDRYLCSLVPWFLPHIPQAVGDIHCYVMWPNLYQCQQIVLGQESWYFSSWYISFKTMRLEVRNVSSMCCPSMKITIVDVRLLVPSSFLLVLYFIVVNHHEG